MKIPVAALAGGKGNDAITNSGINVLFEYAAGDGNDTITRFSKTDTLSISGGEYTRSTVDNNLVIKVGESSITILDAASLQTVNIEGTQREEDEKNNVIILTEDNDTYSNTIEGVTIQALGGDDSIDNAGANVSINGGTFFMRNS